MIRKIMIMGLVVLAGACGPRAKHERLVDRELGRDVRYDSLFLGLRFGMTSEEFFDHCTELNRQQLITQGNRGLTVKYWVKDLDHPATMYFYPGFYKNRIYKLPGYYEYDAFKPGPTSPYSSDSLQYAVLDAFSKQYGEDFIKISHSTRGDAFIRMDGNRHLTLFKIDDRRVGFVFKDYPVDKMIEETRDTVNVADPVLF